MKQGLTTEQRAMFNIIEKFIEKHGHPPSFRELMVLKDLSSTGEVARLVNALEERGWITKMPHRRRTIAIIPDDDLVRPGDKLVNENGDYFTYAGQGKIHRGVIDKQTNRNMNENTEHEHF